MAIQDRNLTAGTKLWAKYKGNIHTAEVIPVLGGTEGEIGYRLANGAAFKSPSAAGTGITGKACNGWTFWSVGEPGEGTSAKAGPGGTVNAVPKPEAKRRGRKAKDSEMSESADDAGDQPPAEEPSTEIECGQCGAILPDAETAAAHFDEVHGDEVRSA